MDSVGYYFVYFSTAVLITIILLFYLRLITEYRLINKNNIIGMFMLLLLINCFSDILNVIIIKNFVTILSFVIFIKYTSNLSYKNSILSFLKLFIIVSISEIINGFLFTYLIHIPLDNKYLIMLVKINGILVTGIICYFYYYIKRKNNNYLLKIDVSWLLMISIFFLLITIGALNFLSTFNKMKSAYYLFLILLIFIIFGVYLIIKLLVNNHNKKLEISDLKSKNSEVIKYINEFKTYKHNLKYDLIAIKESGNIEVKKQIDELLNNNNSELEYINNFKEVPSSLIHVFSDCLTINNDNNIEIIIKNSYKDKELNVDMNNYLQLNKIIGNCLTNSIEAVPDNEGFIYVYFYEDDCNQYVKIVNNFTNNIDIDKLGEVNYSTKNRNSGFGLCSIFSNKENIRVFGSIINNLFEIRIMIPKK